MKLKHILLPAASTFMASVLLASCAPGISPGPATEAPPSYISSARTLSSKCAVIREWLQPFEDQNPSLHLATMLSVEYSRHPQLGALFASDEFAPVFGFTYTKNNARLLASINEQIIDACEVPREIPPQMAGFFRDHRPFFWQTFAHIDSSIEIHAHKNDQYILLARDLMLQMETLLLDRTGLQKLDQELLPPIRPYLPLLPYRHQQAFMNKETAIREAITGRTGRGEGGQPPPTTIPIPSETPPPVLAPLPPQSLDERIVSWQRTLETIPLTLDGRQQSAEWIGGFEREFESDGNYESVVKTRWAWLLKREKIFKATKSDFLKRLAKLPAGQGAEKAHAQLLADTFPLRTDDSMGVYKEYRAAIVARQKPLLRRSFEKTMDGILSVRDWLSDAARKTVRGTGKNDIR